MTGLLGYIGLDQGDEGHCEVEFYIKRPERKKGYCTGALQALCKSAFAGKLAAVNERNERETLILDKNYAAAKAENLPIKKLPEKNGFFRPNTGAKPALMACIDPEADAVYADRIIINMRLRNHKQEAGKMEKKDSLTKRFGIRSAAVRRIRF